MVVGGLRPLHKNDLTAVSKNCAQIIQLVVFDLQLLEITSGNLLDPHFTLYPSSSEKCRPAMQKGDRILMP